MYVRSIASGRTVLLAIPEAWKRMSLARRFVILALCLSAVSTLVLGTWVSEKIEQTARAREAGSAANYMGHFISPQVQNLDTHATLSPGQIETLDHVMKSAAGLRVVGMKIWNRNGMIVYSVSKDAIGDIYPVAGALEDAFAGRTTSDFSGPDAESEPEFALKDTLLEIYAPIRSSTTGAVIAVAEFYEDATELAGDLHSAQLHSWLVTGIVLASIFAGLSTLISDGNDTIRRQRDELSAHITQLFESMRKTEELQERIERGAREVIEDNERLLRTIGSELHDGPAQLISLAQLKLDHLDDLAGTSELGAIRSALANAIRDIRRISAGLLLPNVNDEDLLGCLKTTIRDHEARTGTSVTFRFRRLPKRCAPYVTICLCRFVQEGLANAFRHAGAAGQGVFVEGRTNAIRAQVCDSGPGISGTATAQFGEHLGLITLRRRLESIRGSLTISSKLGVGTTLTAWLPLGGELPRDS